MPGSSRTFTYTIKPDDADMEKAARQARKILGWACEGDKRITCHGVSGDLYGVVQLNLTVVGRDQWWSRRLAQDILNMVTWGLRHPAEIDLLSERQEPHDHRGYMYGRVKQWRERQSPSSD